MNNNYNKGMTLVEIILSLAIFGVMSVVFLNIFLGSYIINLRAEARTDTLGYVSGEMEKQIAEDTTVLNTMGPTIVYNGTYSSDISGDPVTRTFTNDKGQTVTLNYFMPKEL